MKKIISLILIFALALTLYACGSKPGNTPAETTAQSSEAETQKESAGEAPTFKVDDAMVRLGKLVKIKETPFVMKSLVLKIAGSAMDNYNTFKPGDSIEFYIDSDVSAADSAKVKVYLAPFVKDAKEIPADSILSVDYAAAAEEGGVNFTSAIPADTAEGYYNIFFACENTVAYRIAVKISK